jgi:hypothetical protein
VRCFVGGGGGRMVFDDCCLYGYGMAWVKVGVDTWRLDGNLNGLLIFSIW